MTQQQDQQEYVLISATHQEQTFGSWLKSALSDGTNPSTSRLLVMLTIPTSVLLPLFTWTVMSVVASKLVDFPASVTGYVMSVTTLLLSVLHLNKREETKENIAIATNKQED